MRTQMIANFVIYAVCQDKASNMTEPVPNNEYPVYPEDDGYDRFRNPYSPS